jgi:hypothetical protein
MRPATLAGLIVLVSSAAASAQPAAYRAVVTDPEVKLRAGPSDQYPDTGTLSRGSVVIVEKEEANGWLAVAAPPGSVSWVATQFIKDPAPDRPTPKNVYVEEEVEVTLAAGKAGLSQPLDIRRVKLPQGTQLMLIGPKVTYAGKTWYPVVPPAGDVRYLPKTAVRHEKPANDNFTVRVNESTGTPAGTPPPVGPGTVRPAAGGAASLPTGASKPTVNHLLWAQAETAERDGRPDEAERLYFDLARQMNSPGGDHDIANLCYTRIHALREKRRGGSGNVTPPPARGTSGTSTFPPPPAKDDRGVKPGTPTPLPPGSGAADARPQWSGPGTLRRSALTLDGRSAYALEASPGVVRFYVIAGPGVDLEKHVGKRVDVYGVAQTRNGLSKPYIAATGIEPAQ